MQALTLAAGAALALGVALKPRAAPLRDCQGVRLGTRSARCAEAVSSFVEAVLSYGQRWEAAARAASADPSSPLAACLLADLRAAQGDLPAALAALAAAERALDGGRRRPVPRERLLARAYAAWLREARPAEAARLFLAAVRDDPRDLFAAKRAQLMYFFVGDADGMLRAAEAAAPAPYRDGMLAFALEQCGRGAEAEAAGRRGDAERPDDAWAHHGVAHALHFQGRFAEGAAFLEPRARHWARCMSFLYTHNHFHLALCYLGAGRAADARAHFDAHLWVPGEERADGDGAAFAARDKADVQDQLGAMNLLWKLELRGEAAAEWLAPRWRDVAAHCAVPPAHADPLHSLLLVHAAARGLDGGAAAARGVADSVREAALACPDAARRRDLVEVWAAFADGAAEAAAGRHAEAAARMAPAMPRLAAVGGSAEQREVLHEAYAAELRAAGRGDEAAAYWRAYTRAVQEAQGIC